MQARLKRAADKKKTKEGSRWAEVSVVGEGRRPSESKLSYVGEGGHNFLFPSPPFPSPLSSHLLFGSARKKAGEDEKEKKNGKSKDETNISYCCSSPAFVVEPNSKTIRAICSTI